jgi:hypothetical protein
VSSGGGGSGAELLRLARLVVEDTEEVGECKEPELIFILVPLLFVFLLSSDW